MPSIMMQRFQDGNGDNLSNIFCMVMTTRDWQHALHGNDYTLGNIFWMATATTVFVAYSKRNNGQRNNGTINNAKTVQTNQSYWADEQAKA